MFKVNIETKKDRENVRVMMRDCMWKIRTMTVSSVALSPDERIAERWVIDAINELRKFFISKINEEVGSLFYVVMMRLSNSFVWG